MKTQAFAFVLTVFFVHSIIGSEFKTEFDLYREAQKLRTSGDILRTSGDSSLSKPSHNLAALKCNACGHARKLSDEEMMNRELACFLQGLAADVTQSNIHG